MKRHRPLVSFENTLVLIFIFVLFSVILTYIRKYEDVTRGSVAVEQVKHLNSAILVYRVKTGRFPEDLRKLIGEVRFDPKIDEQGISCLMGPFPLDRLGYPVDPWGRRYEYDPDAGIVRWLGKSP